MGTMLPCKYAKGNQACQLEQVVTTVRSTQALSQYVSAKKYIYKHCSGELLCTGTAGWQLLSYSMCLCPWCQASETVHIILTFAHRLCLYSSSFAHSLQQQLNVPLAPKSFSLHRQAL